MGRLFRALAEETDAPFHRLERHEPVDIDVLRAAAPFAILFQDHGDLDPRIRLRRDDIGWHLIRDPRDVLISGAMYHGWSDEDWLHRPRPNLGGKTYQQAIRMLDFDAAVRFEMGRSTGQAVRDMLAFDRQDGRVADVPMHALMADLDGVRFDQLMASLDLSQTLRQRMRCRYRRLHARTEEGGNPDPNHVQNLDIDKWRYLFDAPLLTAFREVHGDAAERLGYRPSSASLLIDAPARRAAYLARFYERRGEPAKAVACLDEGLSRAPDDAELRRLRQGLASKIDLVLG